MPQFYLATDPETGKRTLLTRRDEALKIDPNAQDLNLETDKASLQAAFQELLDQADNAKGLAEAAITIPKPEPKKASYLEDSIYADNWFDTLPIARQLDFAARAMNNARDKL